MINIKLIIEYDGKNYFGWQRQTKRPSIQQTIEDAIAVLLPDERINLIGAGRTDTGVNAFNQAANFKIGGKRLNKKKLKDFIYSLNAILPAAIAIKRGRIVDSDFHSRYSAKKRIYKYFFSENKRSIGADRLFFLKTKFVLDLAKDYCKLLEGTHNFRHFCKNKSDRRGFMSHVYYADVKKKQNGIYVFEICANRFLHSMVRAVIGVMLQVASSKLSLKEFKQKFKNKEPLKIQYVPSNALFLDRVIY